MRLQGYSPAGSPVVSYLNSPSGSIIGSAQRPVGRIISLPGLPGNPTGAFVSVTDFGAVADGTDSRAAIQAALDAAGGVPVYIPPGVFTVGGSLHMNPGQVLVGANSAGSSWLSGTGPPLDQLSTLKALPECTGPVISGGPTSGYVQLRDFQIDGAGYASQGVYVEPYVDGCEAQWLLQRIFVHHAAGDGIYIGQGRRACRGWRVASCYNGSNGIMCFGSDSAWHDCLLGTNVVNGFYAAATQTRLTDSDIWGNERAVVVWNGANQITIQNNSCDRNLLDGIKIGEGCFGINVRGNLFTKNSSGGDNGGLGLAANIHIGPSFAINITDNIFLQAATTDPKVAYHLYLDSYADPVQVKESGNFVCELTPEIAEILGVDPDTASIFGYTNVPGSGIGAFAKDPTLEYWLGHIDGGGILNNTVGVNQLSAEVGDMVQDLIDSSLTASLTAPRVLQNARIILRVSDQTAPGATPTLDVDKFDQFNLTGLNTAITSLNITGTYVDGQRFVIKLKDDGTSRSINFGPSWRVLSGVTAPTATTAGKTIYVFVIANLLDGKFDIHDVKSV